MAEASSGGNKRVTLGGDRGYDTEDWTYEISL